MAGVSPLFGRAASWSGSQAHAERAGLIDRSQIVAICQTKISGPSHELNTSSTFSRDLMRSLNLSRFRLCSKQNQCQVQCSAAGVAVEGEGNRQAESAKKRKAGSGSRLIGTGSATPSRVITNDNLSALVETSDEWIATRTGIRARRVLSDNESLTELAIEASRKALEMAKVDPEDVDLVILCTSTPEDIFGGACQVQAGLGCKKAVAFDLTAACSGFVMGLVTATRFIRGGGYENVLVIGADSLSRYVDWTDRGTCILFGDGSGAVVVRAAADDEEDGLLGFDMRSDGGGHRHLHATVGVSSNGASTENGAATLSMPARAAPNYIQMNGKEVFRFAVKAVPQVVEGALQEAGLEPSNIDWLLLHQANQRILDSVSEKMSIPPERVLSNLVNYGNTSAASIPLALDEAVRAGKVQPGQVVAAAGFGAGLTWASAIFRWA